MNIQTEIKPRETFAQVKGGTVLRIQSKYHNDPDVYVMCSYDPATGTWYMSNVEDGCVWMAVRSDDDDKAAPAALIKFLREEQEKGKYTFAVCQTELKVTVYE